MRRIVRGVKRRVLGMDVQEPDYRQLLFEDLRTYREQERAERILEIGPKDGQDTKRLLALDPKELVLIDLPRMEETNRVWLRRIGSPAIRYLSANVMYSQAVETLDPFDVVWCTGVLYHNPEQLRMIKKLYDLVKPGGAVVLESATARDPLLRRANCVQVIYPPSERLKRKHHISMNITHLPSARAVESWMGMVGFERVVLSTCHRKVTRALARNRAAFLGTKPLSVKVGTYYNLGGEEGFVVGKAL